MSDEPGHYFVGEVGFTAKHVLGSAACLVVLILCDDFGSSTKDPQAECYSEVLMPQTLV